MCSAFARKGDQAIPFRPSESIRDSLAVITAKLVKKMDPVDGLTPYEINGTRILKSTDLTTFSKIVYTKEGTELFPGKLNPGNNLVYRSRYLLEGVFEGDKPVVNGCELLGTCQENNEQKRKAPR
ncbi:hypothetical protein ANCCEY_11912 [Ancylostoma ceylanicum]|uniref:Uncharacterized protein n=1 Tax=Ancylostoma ceylanicum TaxID=53326 RepID=A0A0D6LCM9_9BILA|nr:hypothetical protein ANCCEY_11912 [Ancylostoma ceylanicum]